ncbi:unnamed protein product [Symbiodinium pilosum]|uniref:Calmodulin n=1 Tax=Symbiodinium pilosum TaxID=2952 RepID=A0A812JZI1_SYMPI|nr:unnamed protein product [Symbiodinium pilosum]
MDQRRKLLFAYKVRSEQVKTGSALHSGIHTGAASKVPQLPRIPSLGTHRAQNDSSDVSRSVPGMAMTSSVLKLPLLPESQLSDAEALVLAAATASQSMAAIPAFPTARAFARFGMSRSESEGILPKRRAARDQILEKLALSDQDKSKELPSSRATRGASRGKAARKESFKEVSALLQITRAAQEICLQLSEQRQHECDDGLGQKTEGRHGKKQARSKQKGKKKEIAEETQTQLEAWCRATLASVPEADEATKNTAEILKKQFDERIQAEAEATGEPISSGLESRSARQMVEDSPGTDAASPKSRPVSKPGKKLTKTWSKKWKTSGRDDASYGLPNLQDRLDQIQNTYFGKADMMDEATVQRMRMVFNRFRNSTGNEILQDDLPHAMEFLGYVVTSEEELNQVAAQVTSFREMDFNEFLEFVEKYSRAQFDLYQEMFDTFDADGSGEIEITELRKLLLSIGMVVVRQMIDEALEVVDADGNGQLNFEEFIYFLTVYQHTEGFTKAEVKTMWNIYSGFVAEAVKLKRGQLLQIEDLKDALVAVFGLHSEGHAVRIAHKLCNNANGQKRQFGANEGLSFHEFLIFARGLRIAEQAEYRKHFKRFDQDGSGNINAIELRDVLQALGYRPMRQVIGEVLEEVDFEHDAELDFEEFFHFMLLFKQRDGFSQKELQEYAEVFRKFDRDESDNINVHELGDMLRYLGFSVGTDNLYMLLAQVDVNRNGTLDCNEFLRLMRLHRESELKRLHDIFVHRGVAQEVLDKAMLPTALQDSLGKEVPLNTVLPDIPARDVEFEDFVALADQARMTKVVSERRMAGFSPVEINQLEEMFKHYDKDDSGDIDSFEVQELLNDFGLSCRTIAERQAALDQLDEAKQLAAEAGVQRPRGKVNTMITFWELVQLVRLVKTSRAKAKEEESRVLLEAISFSKQEIDDFRSVFLSWAKYGGLNPAADEGTLGQRVSLAETAAKKKDTEDLDEEEPGLTHSMFQRLLRSLDLQINQQAKQAMEEKLSRVQMTEKNELSFVGFLQMMRWMLDSNFAGINTSAQKVAAARQEDHFSRALQSR